MTQTILHLQSKTTVICDSKTVTYYRMIKKKLCLYQVAVSLPTLRRRLESGTSTFFTPSLL